ncbi:MAG: hypothetical protein HKM02_10905 [Pseudomonadales bacterium]|nr:hypothetical protein [Pseudomonadales bacterium]
MVKWLLLLAGISTTLVVYLSDHSFDTVSTDNDAVPAHRTLTMLPGSVPPLKVAKPALTSPIQVDQSRSALLSMRWAHEHGDARTPPLRRVPETTEPPTAAELADPKAYASYEQRQNLKTYASFVNASSTEIPKIQGEIQQGLDQGIPPDRLAVGEEKLKRIQQMRDQLLAQYPQLNP